MQRDAMMRWDAKVNRMRTLEHQADERGDAGDWAERTFLLSDDELHDGGSTLVL